MRRPTFERWIKQECCRIAHCKQFSLLKLAALAQSSRKESGDSVSRKKLAAAIHLHALVTGRTERLHGYVWKQSLEEKYRRVESAIGARDIQRLALRGTPLLSLPEEYRVILQAFYEAYYAPELLADKKRELQAKARELQLQTGTTATAIANATGVALPNVVAFMKHAAVDKVSIEGARDILAYLEGRLDAEPESA